MKYPNIITVIILMLCGTAGAKNIIYSPTVKSLQTVVNKDWLSPPVMRLNSGDVLNIGFDELSHEYKRFTYHIDHCEADWSLSEEIFESDYLSGFNDNPIEDYQNSINTTVLYTHYTLTIPNERCRLKMSGNYRLTVNDEEGERILTAEFMVLEPLVNVGLEVSANTDIDINRSHQQVSMSLNYGSINITNHNEQIYTVVTQNDRRDNAKTNIKPNFISNKGLKWSHNRSYIFEAGNEYRKFEILALSHPTMGIDRMSWDGHYYNAYPFVAEPRLNYIYDVDANGAFYIRNSDNIENDYTSDYVFVHYKLKSPLIPQGKLLIDGQWTTDEQTDNYTMTYDGTDNTYNAIIMQKQGYYSYRYTLLNDNGTTSIPPTEGSFYQTENRYQAYIYYKDTGGRTWRLVGYRQVEFKP
ncbi:MAG: DUF5103 domain-containing protein [Prevotella sp.]|uniref:type IX secretion system plug protein n=1 Tax=Prevotella sp. PTAC TaxID=2736295 RepID=UPI001557FE49|nr:DUF5103 domain-containing protein [Prevotella sp. PTAC]MCX4293284.1 DUF5103 domain-containing protein [Prevotella sp.]NPD54347.1 DUF5103 domain-containing protein [Prevotella sp. PTAC]